MYVGTFMPRCVLEEGYAAGHSRMPPRVGSPAPNARFLMCNGPLAALKWTL